MLGNSDVSQSVGAITHYLPANAPRPVRQVAQTCDRFLRHEMTTYAAALAYRGLLALFPFAIFLIALVNALDVGRPFEMLADWARTGPQGRVPAAIKEWTLLQARERAEGAVISVGAVASVWAVASGARVLRGALNTAAEMPEVYSPWIRLGISLVAAPAIGATTLTAVLLFTVTRQFLLRLARWFALNEVVVGLWDWLRLPAGLILAVLAICVVYRFAPSHRQPFRAVLPGATFAAIVWAAASLVFSRAVSSVLQFGVTYGSFTAAIVLLVYLYLAAAGLLFGAELNAVLAKNKETKHHPAHVR